MNGIFHRVAHFTAVCTRELGYFGEKDLRFREDFSVKAVESSCDFPCQLDMISLVFSYRDSMGFIDDDVGCLQHGISKKPIGVEVLIRDFSLHFLESGNPLQPGQGDDHGKEKMKLCMLLDLGLDKDHTLIWIYAKTQPSSGIFKNIVSDNSGFLILRAEGMPGNDGIIAVIFILQPYPVLECTSQMSEMERACGPHSAENDFFWFVVHCYP
jgi:hypothetical protein